MLLILLTTLLTADASSEKWQEAQAKRVALIEQLAPSVLAVYGNGPQAATTGGSGVIVSSDGLALTNFHVVQGAGGPFFQCGSGDGKLHPAVILGIDPVGDVALLQLLGPGPFQPAPMGNSDQLEVGQTVLAMGNPFLLSVDFSPTVTMGIISGLHRYQYPAANSILEYTDCIQTDASVNPGNSGGPLFNLAGQVIGINGRISLEKRGRVNVGVAYAISINQIKHFLDHLRGGLVVDHATLGANVTTNPEGQVVVDAITEDSEVFRRGLGRGDEILSFAGHPIHSPNDLKNYLGIYPKGWRLPLVYRQGGDRKTMTPRLLGVLANRGSADSGGEQPTPDKSIPKELRSFFEPKTGFANFAANRKEREALLGRFTAHQPMMLPTGIWKLRLVSDSGEKIEVTLADKASQWKQKDAEYAITREETQALDPPRSGGLLVALGQWRRFLVEREKAFQRCDFAGGFPISDKSICPALDTEDVGVRALWLFDRETGQLVALEVDVGVEDDPCEIRFGAPRELGGYSLPATFEVWHRGVKFGQFTVESAELGK